MSKVFKQNDILIDTASNFLVDVYSAAVRDWQKEHGGKPEPGQPKEETEAETDARRAATLQSAALKAEQVVRDAHRQASQILADASDELATLRRDAYEKGYWDGQAKGLEEGRTAAEAIRKEAADHLAATKAEAEKIIEALEPQMVELIATITGKLLNDTAAIEPAVILNLIRQGVAESTITGDIRIRVSEQDYAAVMENKQEILALCGGVAVAVEKDLSLKQSDCIIETPFGYIDCGLDQRYRQLKNNLYYILNNR